MSPCPHRGRGTKRTRGEGDDDEDNAFNYTQLLSLTTLSNLKEKGLDISSLRPESMFINIYKYIDLYIQSIG
jgi:hypothetical protein